MGDGNDTFGTADGRASVFAHLNASVGFNGDPRDFFSFKPDVSGRFSVQVNGLSGNLDVRIYNQSKQIIGSSTNAGSTSELATAPVTSGQTYYVEVYQGTSGAASSYNILGVTKPDGITAAQVYKTAMGYIGTPWGHSNCTGFTYTVSEALKVPFYAINKVNNEPTGPTVGRSYINDGSGVSEEYRVPIRDNGEWLPVGSVDNADAWKVVASRDLNDTSTRWLDDLSAGDIIRIKFKSVGLFHAGIVAGYDEAAGKIYLIDNGGSKIAGSGASKSIGVTAYDVQDVSSSRLRVERLETEGANSTIYGISGNDTIGGGAGNDWLFGDSGHDLLLGNSGSDTLAGGLGNDTLKGGSNDDSLFGNADADLIYGNVGNDTLHGGDGNDTLYGGAGSDLIEGRLGVDVLAGGENADIFRFTMLDESKPNAPDKILDFQSKIDKIDLSGIDADITPASIFNWSGGDQAFTDAGSAFTGKAGQLIQIRKNNGVLLQGDVNGDRIADFSIEVVGVSKLTPGTDIIL